MHIIYIQMQTSYPSSMRPNKTDKRMRSFGEYKGYLTISMLSIPSCLPDFGPIFELVANLYVTS